jgi:hypothetical protein
MPKSTLLALGVLLAAAPALAAKPANSIQDLFEELDRCMVSVRMAEGTDVTVQFMLNRRGGLIGKPRLTYAHWVGSDADRQASAASIAQGFDHCLPLPITDSLGGAIAGRLIVRRFRAAREENL